MKKYIVIVAGGQGTRMSGTLPKQFITLAGKPILQHTLELFDDNFYEIVLVMNPEFIDFWKDLILQQNIKVKHKIIAGGRSRAESVKNGVMLLDKNSLVAVHDAVRPFVTNDLLDKLFDSSFLQEFHNTINIRLEIISKFFIIVWVLVKKRLV